MAPSSVDHSKICRDVDSPIVEVPRVLDSTHTSTPPNQKLRTRLGPRLTLALRTHWFAHARTPTLQSRKEWAERYGVDFKAVNRWFYARAAKAKKNGETPGTVKVEQDEQNVLAMSEKCRSGCEGECNLDIVVKEAVEDTKVKKELVEIALDDDAPEDPRNDPRQTPLLASSPAPTASLLSSPLDPKPMGKYSAAISRKSEGGKRESPLVELEDFSICPTVTVVNDTPSVHIERKTRPQVYSSAQDWLYAFREENRSWELPNTAQGELQHAPTDLGTTDAVHDPCNEEMSWCSVFDVVLPTPPSLLNTNVPQTSSDIDVTGVSVLDELVRGSDKQLDLDFDPDVRAFRLPGPSAAYSDPVVPVCSASLKGYQNFSDLGFVSNRGDTRIRKKQCLESSSDNSDVDYICALCSQDVVDNDITVSGPERGECLHFVRT